MKRILRVAVGFIVFIVFIIIFVLSVFPIYLESDAMDKDYACAQSKDGSWKVYLIPDPLGMLSGYLIYQGDGEGSIEDIQVSQSRNGEKTGREKLEEETGIDEDFSTKAQKYVLSGETFYQFLEYGDRNAEVDLEIYWKEKDKNLETKLSVNYDKWNPNDIYCTIRYYLGMST